MLVYSDRPASANEIKEALEGNDPEAKIEAMQKAISMLLNGEQLPALFITIVRYVLPSEDHTVQKLLLLYLVSNFSTARSTRPAEAAEERCSRAMQQPHRVAACIISMPGRAGRCSEPVILCISVAPQETIEKTDANGKILPEMVSASWWWWLFRRRPPDTSSLHAVSCAACPRVCMHCD